MALAAAPVPWYSPLCNAGPPDPSLQMSPPDGCLPIACASLRVSGMLSAEHNPNHGSMPCHSGCRGQSGPSDQAPECALGIQHQGEQPSRAKARGRRAGCSGGGGGKGCQRRLLAAQPRRCLLLGSTKTGHWRQCMACQHIICRCRGQVLQTRSRYSSRRSGHASLAHLATLGNGDHGDDGKYF